MSKIKGDVSTLNVLNAPAEQFDVRGEKSITRQADAALAFLRQDEGGVNVAVDEKALLRKIDFLVMPMMLGAYTFQYLGICERSHASDCSLTMRHRQESWLACRTLYDGARPDSTYQSTTQTSWVSQKTPE